MGTNATNQQLTEPMLPPGIRSSRRIQPPAALLIPPTPPYRPGERVWMRWDKLDDDTRLHHSGKRTRSGRVVRCLVEVQFDDEVHPIALPSDQWSRACLLDE